MFQANIVAGPWDLFDPDVDESLDRVQATGARGISVEFITGARRVLRVRAECRPRVFETRGGYFYVPDESRYADARIKPAVSAWLKGRDLLERTVRGCAGRGLTLRARISATAIGRLAARHPECAAQTVWGDLSATTLCPSHPDVRALLSATVRELGERLGSAVVEIADLSCSSGLGDCPGLETAGPLHERVRTLLGNCFCESCRHAASACGVDAVAAAEAVRRDLDALLAQQPAGGYEIVATAPEQVESYRGSQQGTLDRVVRQMLAAAAGEVLLVLPREAQGLVIPSILGRTQAAGLILPLCGPPDHACAFLTDLESRGYPPDRSARQVGPAAQCRTELELVLNGGGWPDAQRLVAFVKRATEEGFNTLSFAHLGLLGEAGLTAVRQAVRYATRESS